MGLTIGILESSRSAAPSITYLLDSYPNAAAAYSLRKLRGAYSGSAIRVRRSSDNTQSDIGFNGSGGLDTTALTTFVGSGNGFVSIWYDQSGNGRNATQTTLTYQFPIVLAGVVYTTNSKPAMYLNGSGSLTKLDLPTGFLNAATNLSLQMVVNIDNRTGENNAIFGPGSTFSAGLEILLLTFYSYRSYLRINNTARNVNSAEAYQLWNDNVQSLTEIYGNTTNVSAYKNNSSVTLTNSTAMPTLNFNGIYNIGNYAGNNASKNYGYIQELIIYTTNQLSNRSGIATNINSYYTIY